MGRAEIVCGERRRGSIVRHVAQGWRSGSQGRLNAPLPRQCVRTLRGAGAGGRGERNTAARGTGGGRCGRGVPLQDLLHATLCCDVELHDDRNVRLAVLGVGNVYQRHFRDHGQRAHVVVLDGATYVILGQGTRNAHLVEAVAYAQQHGVQGVRVDRRIYYRRAGCTIIRIDGEQ